MLAITHSFDSIMFSRVLIIIFLKDPLMRPQCEHPRRLWASQILNYIKKCCSTHPLTPQETHITVTKNLASKTSNVTSYPIQTFLCLTNFSLISIINHTVNQEHQKVTFLLRLCFVGHCIRTRNVFDFSQSSISTAANFGNFSNQAFKCY